MSDLIKRLRLQDAFDDRAAELCLEAADEIERLWAVVDEMPCAYHDIRASDKGQCFCGDCDDLCACDCPKHEALAALSDDSP